MPEFAVLHRLRVAGFVPQDEFPVAVVDSACAAGYVVRRSIRDNEYLGLTSAGRARHAELLHGEPKDHHLLRAAYERFLSLNESFKILCTDWQLQPKTNSLEWRETGYARKLDSLHRRAKPAVLMAARACARFGDYIVRLDNAARKVVGGDPEWLTNPRVDSYHTVWFELHEDFLVSLGLPREE